MSMWVDHCMRSSLYDVYVFIMMQMFDIFISVLIVIVCSSVVLVCNL